MSILSQVLKWGALTTLGITAASALTLYAIARPELGAKASGDRLDRMKALPYFKNGQFVNDEPLKESFAAIVHYFRTAKPFQPAPDSPIKAVKPDPFADPEGRLAVTWFGHSTMLIEIDGMRILTDPVWSKRASPFSFIGPARFADMPIGIDELPTIDAVLISHDHYDHLDRKSLLKLKDKVPLFIMPIGVGAHLEHWGFPARKMKELVWWEDIKLGPVTLTCTPARHFSGRGLTDRKASLWSSWAITGPDNRVFFGGDGGMGRHFAEIGEKLGPFDLSMLEVGAYSPAWPDVHLGPEQAVMAHKALNAKHFMPIHWGTFSLAQHTWTEPLSRIQALNDPDLMMLTPRHGQRIEIHTDAVTEAWWPDLPYFTVEDEPVWSTGYAPK